MLTIEHCDTIHLHLPGQSSILTEAVLAALRPAAVREQADTTGNAHVKGFDAAASGEAFNNTFHKVRAEVSRDWWDRIWKKAIDWATDTAALSPVAPANQPPALGEIWPGQGGRYAGTMPAREGKPGWHLVLGSSSENSAIAFGPYDHDVTGAKDHYDGLANTRALIAEAEEHPAARFAASITADGHADFYLPAHNELMLMWITVPQLFQKEGWYWSSTQYSPGHAWAQDFEGGSSSIDRKTNEFRAVAVRRLEI